MKVLKFGGSSVATPERIENVIGILKSYQKQGEKFAVVFSAFGGATDALIEMSEKASHSDTGYRGLFDTFCQRHIEAAKTLLKPEPGNTVLKHLEQQNQSLKNILQGIFLAKEASKQAVAHVLGFGERYSNYIITNALNQRGIPSSYLDARAIIKTDNNFRAAKVDLALTYEKIKCYFSQAKGTQIVTGFIGSTKSGLTTTLGRGGSDYTAALLAAGLEAEAIEIWTDVDGVLTADPGKVKKAFTIPAMTYDEAKEMSLFGAKVIYPPTIQPAYSRKIPIFIKNTFNPTFGGTFISTEKDGKGPALKGVSSIGSIALLTLSGNGLLDAPSIAGRLFNALSRERINIILITQNPSEHSISFAIQPNGVKKAKQVVQKEFEHELQSSLVPPLKTEMGLAAVAIVGKNMRYRADISDKMLQTFGENGISVIAQGSSEMNVSVVINKADEAEALNALHLSFFLSDAEETTATENAKKRARMPRPRLVGQV